MLRTSLGAPAAALCHEMTATVGDRGEAPGSRRLAGGALRMAALLAAAALVGAVPAIAQEGSAAGRPLVVAQVEAPATPVGEAPPEEEARPEVAVAADVGGVLTRAGVLVLEPSLRFANSSTNRFTFRGIQLVETVLVGVIEAEDRDRNFVEAALTGRLGVTDRFELEARVPAVYRDDRVSFLVPQLPAEEQLQSRRLDKFGLGDVEVAGHYQVNQARPNRPIFVANLRAKLPTGKSPFDVGRDEFGVETDLPTGSGFFGFEPSITALYPSDPVVFFANLGYLWNVKRDIDKQITPDRFVGTVDPGDAIRAGFGMGFAVNEQTSFSIGYSHDYILKTETEINNVKFRSSTLQVGSLNLGFSHRFTPRVRADVTVEIGATSEATDAGVQLRLPISLQLF